jgi:hypothetical protein
MCPPLWFLRTAARAALGARRAGALGLALVCVTVGAAFATPAERGRDGGPCLASVPHLSASTVNAGDVVEIVWNDAGPAVDELELLLSVDGGRTWPLRVSPELGGREVVYRWKVPNLAAPNARLRIRAHLEGREVEGPPGASFTITARGARHGDPALSSEGAWWPGLVPLSAPAGGLRAGAAHIATGLVHEQPGVTPTRAAPQRPASTAPRYEATGLVRAPAMIAARRATAVFRPRRE